MGATTRHLHVVADGTSFGDPARPSATTADPGLHRVDARRLVVHDDAVEVHVSGDMDLAGSECLLVHLLTLAGDDHLSNLVVDLSEVTFIDSAGMRPLLRAWELMRRRGARLSIARPSAVVADFLRIAGYTHMLRVAAPGDAGGPDAALVLTGPWPDGTGPAMRTDPAQAPHSTPLEETCETH